MYIGADNWKEIIAQCWRQIPQYHIYMWRLYAFNEIGDVMPMLGWKEKNGVKRLSTWYRRHEPLLSQTKPHDALIGRPDHACCAGLGYVYSSAMERERERQIERSLNDQSQNYFKIPPESRNIIDLLKRNGGRKRPDNLFQLGREKSPRIMMQSFKRDVALNALALR